MQRMLRNRVSRESLESLLETSASFWERAKSEEEGREMDTTERDTGVEQLFLGQPVLTGNPFVKRVSFYEQGNSWGCFPPKKDISSAWM